MISPVYFANGLYAKALEEYLNQEQFDAVICTHLFGMEAMTAIRKRHYNCSYSPSAFNDHMGSFNKALPTPMRSAAPYCSRFSMSRASVTPPVRITGTDTAVFAAKLRSFRYPGSV